jgi:hypothetical protein
VLHAALVLIALAPGWPAMASMIDTLTGLTPGNVIGCDYIFSNGDPSIPCTQDTVAANGTVSFVEPNAAFDSIEYFDVTTGSDIVELINVNTQLVPGTEYPILQDPPADSFFDVFSDIVVVGFNDNGLQVPGAIDLGETFDFTNGTSSGLPDIKIPGFTGTAEVTGFVEISSVPEPSTLTLFAAGLGGLWLWRRRLPHPSKMHSGNGIGSDPRLA